MHKYTNEQLWAFWNKVMVKLSTGSGLYEPIPAVMAEFCEFFGFGCGLIYMSDYQGDFFLKEKYQAYDAKKTHNRINLKALLGSEFFLSLSHKKQVFVNNETAKSKLEERLCTIFDATSLLLAPVVDSNMELMSFLCITDRRGSNRLDISHMNFAFSILYTISNNIKLVLYHRSISRTEESLKSVLDNMPIGVCINDLSTHEILYANKSMNEKYISREDFLSRLRFESSYESNKETSKKWELQAGDENWYKVISAPLQWTDGRTAHITSLIDITGEKRHEELMQRLADSDDLTGLPNRRKFERDLGTFVRSGNPGYLMFIDLNDFKVINDTMGHLLGDEVLRKIGRHLSMSSLTAGKTYRHGGDEFLVICRGSWFDMQETVEFLIHSFNQKWELDQGSFFCGASIGLSCFPDDAKNAGELFEYADMAMYSAKANNSTNAVLYNGGRFTNFNSHKNMYSRI